MEMKCRLTRQLNHVRGITEKLMESFETPEQWVHQVDPSANHALWVAGHLGTVDNFFLSIIDPNRVENREGWNEMFGMGSKPTNDPSAYPPPSEVVDYLKNRRAELLAALDELSEEDLSRPVPAGLRAMWSDFASVLEMAIWHETMHAGQASVARRSLGNEPLFGKPPVKEEAAT